MYDSATKAVSYCPVSSITPSLTPITLDKTNNRVGINKANPTQALDVDGNIQGTGDLVIDGKVYLQGLVSNPTSQSLFFDPTTKLVSYGNTPSPKYGPAFFVWKSSSQNITTTAETTVIFNSAEFNVDNCYNTSTGRFQPKIAGYYHVVGHVQCLSSAQTGPLYSVIYFNGNQWTLGTGPTTGYSTTQSGHTEVSTILRFNGTTDYAELRVGNWVGWVYLEIKRSNFSGCFLRPL
jgi:hypothetical protein